MSHPPETLEPSELRALDEAGLRWCPGCSDWHRLAAFGRDTRSPDGLTRSCKNARNLAATMRRWRRQKGTAFRWP